MSLSKNMKHYKLTVIKISSRHLNSGNSNTTDAGKMQARTVVLTQWKLMTQLKSYLTKIPSFHNTLKIVLNKELANFLQKIQPTVYGTDFKGNSLPVCKGVNTLGMKAEEISNLIPDALNALKLKIPRKTAEKQDTQRWKETRIIVSKESVVSRSEHILNSLAEATSDDAKISKIDEIIKHVNECPEAKHVAVKQGAIRSLLKMRQGNVSSEIRATINEALALLGYANPVTGGGIRILSIDGGGIRGIVVIEMLKKFEELTGKRVHEMFDLVCGVSTGAIIASLIGVKQNTLDEILDIYKQLSEQIFTQSTLKGTSSLVWSHSYYDTSLWEKLLREQIGDTTLISTSRSLHCPKLSVLSAVVNQSRLSAYVFRNYALPCRFQSQYKGGHHHQIWEAVRASAAAPTYFEEFKLGNMLHQDGGILFNNPTAVAIHEAKLLWPETPIQSVISFGTGRAVSAPPNCDADQATVNSSSWKDKFYAILDSATDTEGVHTMLSDLLPNNVYYRFNPYLTEMLNMAEIDKKKLEQLKLDAVMYVRRNDDKFQEATKILKSQKTFGQKVLDWIHLHKEIYGPRL